jgi:effector-binding domain-containing protein
LIEESLPEKRPSLNNTFTEKIMSFQVQVKTIPPQQILSIRRHPLQKDLQAQLDGGIKTLIVYAQSEKAYGPSKDVQIVGLPFAIYHDRESTENWYIEICLPVEGQIESTREIEVKQLPAVEVAFTGTSLRQSVFPGVRKAYEALEQWISANHQQPVGPPREIYLNYDHSIFSAAAKWEDPCLEIAWPYQPV